MDFPISVLFRCLLILSIVGLSASFNVSIIGGKAMNHDKPWMVSIQVQLQHVCGGTLIEDQWVLTAAHCIIYLKPTHLVTVLLGASSLTNVKGTQRIGIDSFHPSHTFNVKTRAGDIMLIKLKEKAKMKETPVRVKRVPKSQKDIPAGSKCLVIGWGYTDVKTRAVSDTLQGVEVKVLDRDLCTCYYNNRPVITEDMLCAVGKEREADSCTGDSGGPLECNKNIVGLVSGGHSCGDPKKPGVYTRLSKTYLSWIKKVTKGRQAANKSYSGGRFSQQ